MQNNLIDIGANLTHSSFDSDRKTIIEESFKQGIKNIIITGSNYLDSYEAHLLATQYPTKLYSTAGIHPHYAKEFNHESIKLLKNLLTHANVKAVGECGLDYYRNYSSKKSQKIAFEEQIKLAIESKKPIFLHQRDAHNDFLNILTPFANKLNGGVAHCFTGDKDILKEYLDLGLHVGITGWICDDRRNTDLQEAICKIPLDRLLIETDSPYLLPRTIKPKPSSRRNVPSNLHRIVDAISKYTGHSNQVIAEATFINAKKLFYL